MPSSLGCPLTTRSTRPLTYPQDWLQHGTLARGSLEAFTGKFAALLSAGKGPGGAEKGIPAGGGPRLCTKASFCLALGFLLAWCTRGPPPWRPLQLGAHLRLYCSPFDLNFAFRAGQAAGPCGREGSGHWDPDYRGPCSHPALGSQLPSKPCLSFFFLAFWLASILTTEEGEGPSTAIPDPGCNTSPGSLGAASVARSAWQSSLS